jgi:Type IV secretory pathway, VirB11 components, and related ATPases involved in archaeal flagella biosynthesis
MVRITSEENDVTIVDLETYERMLGNDTEDGNEQNIGTEENERIQEYPYSFQGTDSLPSVVSSLGRIGDRDARYKPIYSDCWVFGDHSQLNVTEKYVNSRSAVTIGVASDGEVEYNVIPHEYDFNDELNGIVHDLITTVRNEFLEGDEEPTKHNITARARSKVLEEMEMIELICKGDEGLMNNMINGLSDTVFRYTAGLGIFDILLSDPRLEDIYVDAPCDRNRIHVTLNSSDNQHLRCRTNLMIDASEMRNLISSLKRDSGLPFCETSPVLETDIKGYDARATVIGYPMSPDGDAVALRKHSAVPWTLAKMIGNGTMDHGTAGLLSFLVNMRSTFLIGGARGSGKSSLLSAMMFEFPLSQRILTIEDTKELPADKMRRMGYKIQSMLIDDRRETAMKRSDEALRVSLRLGESAIILGEVRGEEARTLYQSMRTGKAGSSIMGTIHGDSARSVYERVVHDLNIAPEAFMSTDVIVTMGTRRGRGSTEQTRDLNELVATSDRPGVFIPLMENGAITEEAFKTPIFRRIMASASLNRDDVIKEVNARSGIRRFLADVSVDDPEFSNPEWISMANEFLSRQLYSGEREPEVIVNGFKRWFGRYNGTDL